MTKNMGTLDRAVRTVVAVVVGYLWWTGSIAGTLGIVLLIAAVVFVLTSLISFCPLYRLVGMSTCRTKS